MSCTVHSVISGSVRRKNRNLIELSLAHVKLGQTASDTSDPLSTTLTDSLVGRPDVLPRASYGRLLASDLVAASLASARQPHVLLRTFLLTVILPKTSSYNECLSKCRFLVRPLVNWRHPIPQQPLTSNATSATQRFLAVPSRINSSIVI